MGASAQNPSLVAQEHPTAPIPKVLLTIMAAWRSVHRPLLVAWRLSFGGSAHCILNERQHLLCRLDLGKVNNKAFFTENGTERL